MGILTKPAWLPACPPVAKPAGEAPSAPSAPDPYRHPSRLSPETNLPFQTEDPDKDHTVRTEEKLAGMKRSIERGERETDRSFGADEIDFDRECEMDRLLSRGCAKLNGGEKDLLALNLRAAAVRTALACRHATGEELFVFANGTVALKDGTCGVVLARHGGFVFLVPDSRGYMVPHTVFAGAGTQSALFGGRALGQSRVVRLRFEGKDLDVGLDGSGRVFAVFDGEGKGYAITFRGGRMEILPLRKPLPLPYIRHDTNGACWLFHEGRLQVSRTGITHDGRTGHYFPECDAFIAQGTGELTKIPPAQAIGVSHGDNLPSLLFERRLYVWKPLPGGGPLHTESASGERFVFIPDGAGGFQPVNVGRFSASDPVLVGGLFFFLNLTEDAYLYFAGPNEALNLRAIGLRECNGKPIRLCLARKTTRGARGDDPVVNLPVDAIVAGALIERGIAVRAEDLTGEAEFILTSAGLFSLSSLTPLPPDTGETTRFFAAPPHPDRGPLPVTCAGRQYDPVVSFKDGLTSYMLASPVNTDMGDPYWRLLTFSDRAWRRAEAGDFKVPFNRAAWHRANPLFHNKRGILEFAVRGGRVWDVSRIKDAGGVQSCLGNDGGALPEDYMAFRRDGARVVPMPVSEMESRLDDTLIRLPEPYLDDKGRVRGLAYAPEGPAWMFADSPPGNVITVPSYALKAPDGDRGNGNIKLHRYDVFDPSGRSHAYLIPDPEDPLTVKAKAAGYYIPDDDDILAFHDRLRRLMPVHRLETLGLIAFYPLPGLSPSLRAGRVVAGSYLAQDAATPSDSLGFYGVVTEDREDWLAEVTGRLLAHEVLGHGTERGDDEVRKLVLQTMILDGATSDYGDTDWREYFAVLCEYFLFEPELRHRFPWGYRLVHALLTSR